MKWLRAIVPGIESAVVKTSKGSNVVGVACIVVMLLLVTSDVIGRFFFKKPVPGTIDVTESALLLAAFLSFAYSALVKANISVDLVVRNFSKKGQAITDTVTTLATLALLSIMAWALASKVGFSLKASEASQTLLIPYAPLRGIAAFGIALLCLVLIVQVVQLISSLSKK